jgi:hypothetical protein
MKKAKTFITSTIKNIIKNNENFSNCRNDGQMAFI